MLKYTVYNVTTTCRYYYGLPLEDHVNNMQYQQMMKQQQEEREAMRTLMSKPKGDHEQQKQAVHVCDNCGRLNLKQREADAKINSTADIVDIKYVKKNV